MPTQSQLLPITYAHYCSTVMLWLSACLLSLPPTLPPHSFCFILPQALILKSFYKKTHHVLEGYGQSGISLCFSALHIPFVWFEMCPTFLLASGTCPHSSGLFHPQQHFECNLPGSSSRHISILRTGFSVPLVSENLAHNTH